MKERKERIEKLLERYFEARTTDAEEQELKAYFREGETDPGRKRRFLRLCGIAAAAVVALGLFLCVEYMRRPYCYIDGQAVYDKDVAMRTTVYLQGFSEFADPEHLVEELIVND